MVEKLAIQWIVLSDLRTTGPRRILHVVFAIRAKLKALFSHVNIRIKYMYDQSTTYCMIELLARGEIGMKQPCSVQYLQSKFPKAMTQC